MNKELLKAIEKLYSNPITRLKETKRIIQHIDNKETEDLELSEYNYLRYNKYTLEYEIDNYLILTNTRHTNDPKRIWKIDVTKDYSYIAEQNKLSNKIKRIWKKFKKLIYESNN